MRKVDLNLSWKMLKTKNEALESVPQIPEEQVPNNEETTKELVDGSEDIKKRAKKHTRK
jgi:hypothetical protein